MTESGSIDVRANPTAGVQLASCLIQAQWPAPANVVALTTTRLGGFSAAPFDSFNLALHVGDSEQAVLANRRQLLAQCAGLECIQWLEQVHGTEVVTAPATVTAADACYTQQPALACAVMTADCLPIVFCDGAGREVAAAHAGWRGLLAGVLEATVARFSAGPEQLLAWIGPAIGERYFEVGAEVRQAFINVANAADREATDGAFRASKQRQGHYFADLAALARLRLRAIGLRQCYGGEQCCYQQEARFFSYRRQATTGRMATLIYKLPI